MSLLARKKSGRRRLAELSALVAALSAGLSAADSRVPDRVGEQVIAPPTIAVLPDRIEPTAGVIPANTLRFYVYFTGNARGVFRQDQMSLVDAGGRVVASAFMDFGQELWSADGRRLTLLIDPGRIKRGVTAGETDGPVLRISQRYQFTVAWTDDAGRTHTFTRQYEVGPAQRTPLTVRAWSLSAPPIGTRTPLVIKFDRPMDEALLADSLAVIGSDGKMVKGLAVVDDGMLWRFTPDTSWRPAQYRVIVTDRLEDLSGNRVGEALDHEVGTAPAGPQSESIAFTPAVRDP